MSIRQMIKFFALCSEMPRGRYCIVSKEDLDKMCSQLASKGIDVEYNLWTFSLGREKQYDEGSNPSASTST